MPVIRLPYDPDIDEDPTISWPERLRLKLAKYGGRTRGLTEEVDKPPARTVFDRLLDEEDLL